MPEIKDEFDDLVAQLIEERPQIDAEFAQLLDERAAAGFPRRRRLAVPSVKWRLPMWVPAGGLAAAVAVIVAVSAVSGGSGTSNDSSSGSAGGASVAAVQSPEEPSATSAERAPEPGAADQSFQALQDQSNAAKATAGSQAGRDSAGASPGTVSPSLSSVSPASPPPTGSQRVQELSAAITVEVPPKEIQSANDQIMLITNEMGGFVESSNVRSTDGDTGGGNYVLRVPVDKLQDTLTRLGRLGHVKERTQGVQDITSERNVARDQLREAKAVRISLLKRIAEADTDAEVAALRAQLHQVNNQIGAYRAQLRNVERRAAFAQVTMTLTAKQDDGAAAGKKDDSNWTVGDAFDDAGKVLEVVAGVAVIAFAILIPVLMLVAAILATRRVFAKRGRERALDAI